MIRQTIGSVKILRLGNDDFKTWDIFKDLFNNGSGDPSYLDEETLRIYIKALGQWLDVLLHNSGFPQEVVDKAKKSLNEASNKLEDALSRS